VIKRTVEKMPKKTGQVIAVDIGGTKIMTALFNQDGKMLARDTRPTLVNEGVDAVIKRLGSAIEEILGENRISLSQLNAIGIACAGGIDTPRGVVVTPSPNMPDWVEVQLADVIRKKFGVATYVINDASAAALGEHRYGVGKGVKNLVLFTLGTGIGGGIIVDGKLYLGAVGGAGELGHMTVDANGPRCGCGNTGCLEMLASGRAIERDAINRIRQGARSSLSEMVNGEIEKITAAQVGVAARSGDPIACDIISRAAYYLGIGFVNAVNIFNPEMVVIGGGMAELGDMIIEPGRRMVVERAFSVSSRGVRLVTTLLGNEAGVYGAATFVLDRAARRMP
jgi:glucokinase